MNIETVSSRGVSSRSLKEAVYPVEDRAWRRNPSWLDLPSVVITDEIIVGLYAIWDTSSNFICFKFSGDYHVDWGDGTEENISATVLAYHIYDFDNVNLVDTNIPVTFTEATDVVNITGHSYTEKDIISFAIINTTTGLDVGASYWVVNPTANTFQLSYTEQGVPVTLTNDGTGFVFDYKQAVVSITPQAGQQITSFSLNESFVSPSFTRDTFRSSWLDVTISVPNCTGALKFGGYSSLNLQMHRYVEQLNILTIGLCTSIASLCCYCINLEKISWFDTSGVQAGGFQFSFGYTRRLRTVPLYDTSNLTTFGYVFAGAYGLRSIPLFDLSNVTSMIQCFYACSNLREIPHFDTSKVESFAYTFVNCYKIKKIPFFDTSSTTNMRDMFRGCVLLTEIPPYDTKKVTQFTQMFYSCNSLITIPQFDYSAATSVYGMFRSAYSIKTLPPFKNLSSASMTLLFDGTQSLATVPFVNTTGINNFTRFFGYSAGVVHMPWIDTSSATIVTSMFLNDYDLRTIPALDFSNVITGLDTLCESTPSLGWCDITGISDTVSFAGCSLSGEALDNIYTRLGTVVGKTITVTGNPGVGDDDPLIATAKGWTVTS